MHRTKPGVNWREIERANRRAAAERLRAATAETNATSAPGFWQQRGPTGVTGRTWSTAEAADGTTLLIGSGDENGGGLFSGIPESPGWTQRGNPLGTGVQQVVSVAGAPETWVAATGENTDLAVSSDQGVTWHTPTGIPFAPCGWSVPRLLREAPPSRTVYALLTALPCQDLTSLYYTLLRSTDGGLDFQTVIANTDFAATPDLWIDRVEAGPLYLLTDAGLESSANHGATFVRISSRLPGSYSDLRLAGSEGGAPTLYAVASSESASTVFSSLDAGKTWAQKATITDFSVPYGAVAASLSTPRTLLLGGVNAYLSTDGGATFNKVNDWGEYLIDPETKLHADIRGIECIVYQGSETFFVDTDGGTYTSQNLGATFDNLTRNGMVNDEYYSTLTSKNDPNLIAAGSQDQGFQTSTPTTSGIMGFTELITGDYGHLTSTNGDHNMLYAAYPGFTEGALLVQTQESPPTLLEPFCAYPAARARSWMPFLLADPLDANAVYLTGDPLYRIVVDGTGCHATAAPQNFSHNAGDYLTALAISSVNPKYWYAASALGRFWYSHDQGATWTLSASVGTAAPSFYGTTIAASPSSATTCWVGGSGYDGPAIYRTTDGGVTWQAMGAGLPPTLVFGLAFDDPAKQNLYAAADAGAFVFDTGSATWKSIVNGDAPIAGYWSVEGVPSLSAVRFGTYGKGIWDYVTAAASCNPGPGTLCLDDQPGDRRWQVTSSYHTDQGGGSSGAGQAIPLDTLGLSSGGLFWFFGRSNPEMLIKVLNGCAVDQHFWVFDSATTNVGFTVTVTDTKLGRNKVYTNVDGAAAVPIQDTAAFACIAGSDSGAAPLTVPVKPFREERFAPPSSTGPQLSSSCATTSTALCIDGRFEVNLTYDTTEGGGSSGNGHAIPLESLNVVQGGLFWFFAANNPEMLVKVLDGCAVNGKYWVFYAAGTNVGFKVNVLDTVTGHSVSYRNADQTTAASVQDTSALPCS